MATDSLLLSWGKEINGIVYQIDTSRHRLDEDFINDAFASADMPWAKRLSHELIKETLDNSLTLGLYVELPEAASEESMDEPSSPRTPSPTLKGPNSSSKQIGLARLITDQVTFAWLTDVYIEPQYRRFGLARWLMACTREVLEKHPAMRRAFCVTGLEYGAEFYKATLDFHNVTDEAPDLIGLTRRFGSH